MPGLDPGGCCCADETLGVVAEAALAFVSQGFSGVDVAIACTGTLPLCLDWELGGASRGPNSQTGYFGTEYRITPQGVSCAKKMATQTEVVTVTGSEDQAGPDTSPEQSDGVEKKQNWLRRRFKKDKDEKKTRKPPGERIAVKLSL